MALRLVTAATEDGEPVSLQEAKRHMVVLHDADDLLIRGFITAAREVVEQQTGYALATATYDWTPVGTDRTELPIEPAEVVSGPDDYPIRITTKPGPAPAAAQRRASAGYCALPAPSSAPATHGTPAPR